MVVYEAFDYYNIITLTHTIMKRWEQDFSSEVSPGQTIHDFDILEGSYILLYTGDNQTLVYQIEMQIYWTYRMVFPLFREYQNYTYYSSTAGHFGQRRIVRSASSNYMAILMSNEGTTEEPVSFQLFFYSFSSSQHDSLLMVQNVTRFFSGTGYQDLYLIGDGEGDVREVTLLSDYQLSLNDIRVNSELVLSQDP